MDAYALTRIRPRGTQGLPRSVEGGGRAISSGEATNAEGTRGSPRSDRVWWPQRPEG